MLCVYTWVRVTEWCLARFDHFVTNMYYMHWRSFGSDQAHTKSMPCYVPTVVRCDFIQNANVVSCCTAE